MNKHRLAYGALALVIVAALVTIGAFPNMIGGVARASSANVISDFGCMIDLGPIGGGLIDAEESHAVETPSGTWQFKCQGTIPEDLRPDKTVRESGLGCLLPDGSLTDAENLYTPSGQAIVTCNANPSN